MSYGPVGPVKSWLDRMLETAVLLVVIGLLLNWAWDLIRPLVPVMLVVAGLSGVVAFGLRRNQRW